MQTLQQEATIPAGLDHHFKFYSKGDILSLTHIRRFETKLGERVQVIADRHRLEESLQQSTARYVLFGIPEDIGLRADGAEGGTDTGWIPFLSALLNHQSNDFAGGEELLLLGHFDFGDLQYLIEQHAHGSDEKISAYRHAVNRVDEEVESLVKHISTYGKIPIVIGGGHNNAYPLIKGSAKGLYKAGAIPLAQINAINLDAHTGYRPSEGRHSGNAFRYAEEDGYLLKYCVIGVQEDHLPQNVWLDIVNNPFLDLVTYEDIFVHEKRNFTQAVADATGFTDDNYTGIELDLDCLEGAVAGSCSGGVTALMARRYVDFTAMNSKPAYLHICGGSGPGYDSARATHNGKLTGALVSDFIKSHSYGKADPS